MTAAPSEKQQRGATRTYECFCFRACATHAAAQGSLPNSQGGCLNAHMQGIWLATSAQHEVPQTELLGSSPRLWSLGPSTAQELLDGPARALENWLCTDESFLCTQGRITFPLSPHLKHVHCLELPLQQLWAGTQGQDFKEEDAYQSKTSSGRKVDEIFPSTEDVPTRLDPEASSITLVDYMRLLAEQSQCILKAARVTLVTVTTVSFLSTAMEKKKKNQWEEKWTIHKVSTTKFQRQMDPS